MAQKNRHTVTLGNNAQPKIIPITDLQIGEYGIVVGINDVGHQNGRILGRNWTENPDNYAFFALDNPGSTWSGFDCSLKVRKLEPGETIELVIGI